MRAPTLPATPCVHLLPLVLCMSVCICTTNTLCVLRIITCVFMSSKAWLSARVSLRLDRMSRPARARPPRRSCRLCATLVAAPVLFSACTNSNLGSLVFQHPLFVCVSLCVLCMSVCMCVLAGPCFELVHRARHSSDPVCVRVRFSLRSCTAGCLSFGPIENI